MKTLLSLFILTALSAADPALLLPHRWQDARHEIGILIKQTRQSLTLATDALDDPVLRRALRHAIESGRRVALLTSSESTASQWAMYKNVDACLLPGNIPMTFTLVTTDDKRSCLVTGGLDRRRFRHDYGLVHCGPSRDFDEALSLLKRECRPYFGEE